MKKTIVLILSVLILIWILSACKSTRALRQEESEVSIDSSLYFQPVAVSDPFLDSLKQMPDKKVTMQKEVYPPPKAQPVGPFLKEVEGYRVQIFAGIDSINSLSALYQAKDLVPDSVYLFKEKGLYKVQVGDYQFRPQADNSKTHFRQNGFPGAWVVQRSILIPVDSTQTVRVTGGMDTGLPVKTGKTGKYKIQVFVTSSMEKAQLTILDVKDIGNYNAFYEGSGDLFKVFVGPFEDEQQARRVLEDLRQNGFTDAWLVY
jgi:hypothetical protein